MFKTVILIVFALSHAIARLLEQPTFLIFASHSHCHQVRRRLRRRSAVKNVS